MGKNTKKQKQLTQSPLLWRSVFFGAMILLGIVAGYQWSFVVPGVKAILAIKKTSPVATKPEKVDASEKIIPVNLVATSSPIRAPILVYHSVRPHFSEERKDQQEYNIAPEVFEQQLQYLARNGYTVIPFDDLIDALLLGRRLPEYPVVLNFDDGWDSQFIYAFPLLKKYHAPATFFIFTNAIGIKNYLTWEQLKKLQSAGMSIGGHTRSHPYLFKITEEKKLRDEIITSKEILEKHLGTKIKLFAYPFGYPNVLAPAILQEAGYEATRIGAHGATHTKDGRYELRSFQVSQDMQSFERIFRQK